MPLVQQVMTIVPTPSGVTDGHYPDGNDGSGTTMTWANIPNFPQQQGSFSIPMASYLTVSSGTPSYSILSGALVGDWAINSSTGVFSGTTNGGPTNFKVRATNGAVTADTNVFIVEVVTAAPDADTTAPTIPSGLTLVSKTTTTIVVKVDAPADVPYSTQPARGMKECRFLLNGSFSGAVSMAPGLMQKFVLAETGVASDGRREVKGHYVNILQNQADTAIGQEPAYPRGGIPGGSTGEQHGWHRATTGPACPGVNMLVQTYTWAELETAKGVYDFGRIHDDLKQCHGLGVYLLPLLYVRTFAGHGAGQNPAPNYALSQGNFQNLPYCCAYAKVTPSGNNGYNISRWNSEVLDRFQALMIAFAAEFNLNTGEYVHLAGWGSQETATSLDASEEGQTAYNKDDYLAGLNRIDDIVTAQLTWGRHWGSQNFLSGGNPYLDGYAEHMAGNGSVITGPDILPGNAGLVANTYPRYKLMRSKMRKACSMQNDSMNNAQSLTYVSQWGRDNLYLDGIFWNFRTSGAGNQFYGTPDNALDVMGAELAAGNNPYGPVRTGSSTQSATQYTVVAAGDGINAVAQVGTATKKATTSADSYSSARVAVSGDFTFTAKLQSLTAVGNGTTSGSCAGLCVRDVPDNHSRAVHCYVTGSSVVASYRSATGAAVVQLGTATGGWNTPTWLQIRRSGNLFSCFYSKNGLAWTQLGSGTQSVTMTNPVQADCWAASMNFGKITAIFNQVCLQNIAPLQYTFSGLTSGTSYDLSVVARDLATTPNDSAPSPVLTVVTSGTTGVTRKWDPGLYVMCTATATTGNDQSSTFQNDLNKISAMSGTKGICFSYTMRVFEPITQGVYDYTILDRDINRCSSAGKKIGIRVMDRIYNGATNPTGSVTLPDYLINDIPSYGAGTDGVHSGYWAKSTAGYTAALWRASVMDRYIALMQDMANHLDPANGQTLDNSSNVAWVEMPITDLFLAAGSDYTAAALVTQLKRFQAAATAAWPKTPVRMVCISLTGISDLVNTIQAAHGGIGGTDVRGINGTGQIYFDAQRAWCGTFDATSVDQRGKMPIIQQVGTGELDGSSYATQGSPYSCADLQSTLAFLGTHYAVWQIINATGAGNWTAQVQPFLATNPATVTTRPTGW